MAIQTHAIEDIRRRLETRRQELLSRQRRVDSDLARRNETLDADSDDRAIQLENDEPLQAIGQATEVELQGINRALERLTLGLYGICARCGGAIPEARLQAVPHATRCADCANG